MDNRKQNMVFGPQERPWRWPSANPAGTGGTGRLLAPLPRGAPFATFPPAPAPTLTINAHYLALLASVPLDQPLPGLHVPRELTPVPLPQPEATLEPVDDDYDVSPEPSPAPAELTPVAVSANHAALRDLLLGRVLTFGKSTSAAEPPSPGQIAAPLTEEDRTFPEHDFAVAQAPIHVAPAAKTQLPCAFATTPQATAHIEHIPSTPPSSPPSSPPPAPKSRAHTPDTNDFSAVEKFLDLGPCDAPALPSLSGHASTLAFSPGLALSSPKSALPEPPCVELTQDTPAPGHSTSKDPPSPDMQPDLASANLPQEGVADSPPPEPKRQGMRGKFRAPRPIAAADEQWRVGKPPGWQGLTTKRRADALSDDEEHDMAASAARVLKRPFRPPSRVVLPPAPSTPTAPNRARPRPLPSPKRLVTTARAKPFRVPLRSADDGVDVSDTLTPTARRAGSGGTRPTDLNTGLIASLQARARTLRQAVKYSDAAEDARVVALVHSWREAGREVADRLFALLPAPSDEPSASATRGAGGWSATWGFDDATPTSPPLTRDQLTYLRSAPTNSSGEPLDADGNRIFPDIDLDLDVLLRGDIATPSDTYVVHQERAPTPPPPEAWDKGAMLRRLGVDPDLLAWDAEAEDWAEVDDD